MQVQKINAYSQYNSAKQNNNPNFQQMKIYSPKHWDKDILNAIQNNKELKKFENYLEKHNSILELSSMQTKSVRFDNVDEYTIDCIYDRHSNIFGESEVIFHSAPKEAILTYLNKFKADRMIDKLEQKHNRAPRVRHVYKNEENKPNAFVNFCSKILKKITSI